MISKGKQVLEEDPLGSKEYKHLVSGYTFYAHS